MSNSRFVSIEKLQKLVQKIGKTYSKLGHKHSDLETRINSLENRVKVLENSGGITSGVSSRALRDINKDIVNDKDQYTILTNDDE